MTRKKLIVHENEGSVVPDICGTAIELINQETSGATNLSFAKLIIAPGEKSRQHFHEKTEEIYYILSGSGKVIIGDEVFNVIAGHAILLPINVPHQIYNTGDEELIFLCADAPIFDPKDVFE